MLESIWDLAAKLAFSSEAYLTFSLHFAISLAAFTRKDWDSNPGSPFRGTLAFKASAFNQTPPPFQKKEPRPGFGPGSPRAVPVF